MPSAKRGFHHTLSLFWVRRTSNRIGMRREVFDCTVPHVDLGRSQKMDPISNIKGRCSQRNAVQELIKTRNDHGMNLDLQVMIIHAIETGDFRQAEAYLEASLDRGGSKNIQGLLHYVKSKLTKDYRYEHYHRIEAARIWKEIFTRSHIPCTLCLSRSAVVMNCPWNGTVCADCCTACANKKGYCEYLG